MEGQIKLQGALLHELMNPAFTVERDTENGVQLQNAWLFCRGGKALGLSSHLFGYLPCGTWQVCSPIRSVKQVGESLVFCTRSYNKYVVKKTDFNTLQDDGKNILNAQLSGWLGTDKIVKIFDVNTDLQSIPLFGGEPHPYEKMTYGVK